MTSLAEDCWKLSKDCSQWAVESRDGAARLAFRQMATAWAQLAFHETSSAADENGASSPAGSEKGTTASNPAAENARNLLDDCKLIDSTWARLAFNEEFTAPAADEHSDRPTSESSVPNPAENAASSPAVPAPTANENGATARNPAAKDTPNYEQTARPSTDKTPDLSWKHIRLSLRSPMSFPKR